MTKNIKLTAFSYSIQIRSVIEEKIINVNLSMRKELDTLNCKKTIETPLYIKKGSIKLYDLCNYMDNNNFKKMDLWSPEVGFSSIVTSNS